MGDEEQKPGLFESLLSSAFSGFGSALGGNLSRKATPQAAQGMPYGPSQSTTTVQTSVLFDSSGWVTATGSGSARGSLSKTSQGQNQTYIPVSNGSMLGDLPSLTAPGAGISTTDMLMAGALLLLLYLNK